MNEPSSAPGKRVLVADDEASVRMSVKMLLSRLGSVRIDEARDGNDALAKIYNVGYDLVLLDMLMPGMNGIEFINTLQIMDPKPPVVIISAYTEKEEVKAVAHLADAVIQKPFSTRELESTCRRLLGL